MSGVMGDFVGNKFSKCMKLKHTNIKYILEL